MFSKQTAGTVAVIVVLALAAISALALAAIGWAQDDGAKTPAMTPASQVTERPAAGGELTAFEREQLEQQRREERLEAREDARERREEAREDKVERREEAREDALERANARRGCFDD